MHCPQHLDDELVEKISAVSGIVRAPQPGQTPPPSNGTLRPASSNHKGIFPVAVYSAASPRELSCINEQQGLAIGRIDLFYFCFNKDPERRRHVVHPIRMVLLDQDLISVLDVVDCRLC